MAKPMRLLKPCLNPSTTRLYNSTRHFPLFTVDLGTTPSTNLSFRLVPHANASNTRSTVWDEAADAFFGAKGVKSSSNDVATSRSGEFQTSGKGRERSSDRSHGRRDGDNINSNVRFPPREWESKDSRDSRDFRARENVAERSGYSSRTNSQSPSKDVSFAGREWGFGDGSKKKEGRVKSDTRESSSTWDRRPSNNSKPWNSDSSTRGRSNGYRNDRQGGYGGEKRAGRREKGDDGEFDDEEIGGDSEDWPKRESVNWRLEGEPIYGVAPIRAAFLAGRRQFYTLYVQENLAENVANGKRKDKQAVNWVLSRAHNLEMKVKTVSKHDLNLLVENRPHQGLVLDASPLELVPCEFLEKPMKSEDMKFPVWVALDEVIDPQNFGAILRSCHYLGATGIVVCAKNSAPLSGVVSKASAGALEVMEIQSCRNMMKFLDSSVQNGWRAVGASSEPKALPIQNLPPGLPTILVLGNEGRGLRTNVKRSCTDLVSIGGAFSKSRVQSGAFQKEEDSLETLEVVGGGGAEVDQSQAVSEAVDSLNVSVAAGILLHELLSRSLQPSTPSLQAE